MKYDTLIIGAGPGGIFGAYELIKLNPNDYDFILIAGSTSSSNTLELLNKAEEIQDNEIVKL